MSTNPFIKKNMFFAQPDPNTPNNGWVTSINIGQLGANDYIMASTGFDCRVDLYRVQGTGQPNPGRNTTQTYNVGKAASCPLKTPGTSVQVDSATSQIYVSTADGQIQSWNPQQGSTLTAIGAHTDTVCNLRWLPGMNCLLSAGYDGNLVYWDPRTAKSQGSIPMNTRIVSMDANDQLCVVALEGKTVALVDLRKPTTVMSSKPNGLDFDSVIVTAMYKNVGYVVTALDGRNQVEYLTQQWPSFPFRAHREAIAGSQDSEAHVFSAMTCHPVENTLVTCATDGQIITWDHFKKSKVATCEKFADPITSVSFSPDGAILGIASSYNWYRGAAGNPAQKAGYTGAKIAVYPVDQQTLVSPPKA